MDVIARKYEEKMALFGKVTKIINYFTYIDCRIQNSNLLEPSSKITTTVYTISAGVNSIPYYDTDYVLDMYDKLLSNILTLSPDEFVRKFVGCSENHTGYQYLDANLFVGGHSFKLNLTYSVSNFCDTGYYLFVEFDFINRFIVVKISFTGHKNRSDKYSKSSYVITNLTNVIDIEKINKPLINTINCVIAEDESSRQYMKIANDEISAVVLVSTSGNKISAGISSNRELYLRDSNTTVLTYPIECYKEFIEHAVCYLREYKFSIAQIRTIFKNAVDHGAFTKPALK